MNRREFIETSGAAAGGAMLGNLKTQVSAPENAEQNLQKKAKIKLGLYSISYGGIWYKGEALSFDQLCQKAKEYGYDGVELDNKRPMGNPLDLDEKKRDGMKNSLARYGLEIPAIAANNDFSSPVPEHRECQLLMVRETARLAREMGAKVVRLFAAWPGVPIHDGVGTYDFVRGDSFYSFMRQYPYVTMVDRWNHTLDCLKEAAKYGEEFGVTMVLQNHAPLIKTWKDVLTFVKQVNSPWLKVCLDLPIFEKQDKEYIANAVRTIGNLQTHSHFGGEYYRDEKGIVKPKLLYYYADGIMPDYSHYIQLMNEIGYSGYFTFELCHTLLNEDNSYCGIDFVHEQVQMAREYMAGIIK
ncbi:MAG TPA: sugar phosphate isomerase/epimerase family protein [Bacteroidales bacterium]|nr:sugar phosphate isomerase/epimerase family protein [Bacteroidales bacterium]